MKALLASLILFSSTFAFSCPQLAGEYTCSFGGEPTQLKVDQRLENNIQIYKVVFQGLEQEFVTDGISRTATRDGEKIVYSAICAATKIIANLQTESEGAVMETKITVVKEPTSNVKLIYEIMDPTSSEPAMKEEIACKKIR